MTQKPPNLGVVSPKAASEDASSADKRRLPRLALTTELFRLSQNGKVFPVVDISENGMAIRILEPSDLVIFPAGAEFEGTLNLRRRKVSVRARVRNLGPDRVGCEFTRRSDELVAELTQLLDPAELGKLLRPLPAVQSGMLWYHGPCNTHLQLWRGTDGKYRRLTVIALGHFVHWEESQGILTGTARPSFEPEEIRGAIRFESVLLERDFAADSEKLQVAKSLLLRSNLPKDLVSWCVRQLSFD